MEKKLSFLCGFILSVMVFLMVLKGVERTVPYFFLVVYLILSFFLFLSVKGKKALLYSDFIVLAGVFFVLVKDFFVFYDSGKDYLILYKDVAAISIVVSFVFWMKSSFFEEGVRVLFRFLLVFGFFLCVSGLSLPAHNPFFLPNYAPALLFPYWSICISSVRNRRDLISSIGFTLIVFSFSVWYEARGVSLALLATLGILVLSGFSKKIASTVSVGFFIFVGAVIFYLGLEMGDSLFWNALLTWRPTIWSSYLDSVIQYSVFWGLGPIPESESLEAAEAVKFIAGYSGESYGTHSMFITFFYWYGILASAYFFFLIGLGYFRSCSRYWVPFTGSTFLALSSTVYIGVPYIYGVFLTLMLCAVLNKRVS